MRNDRCYPKPQRIPLLICALLFLARIAFAADAPARLQLSSTSLSELRAHSGQRVVLSGHFRRGFEVSALWPAKQKLEELDHERAVWVEFVDGEEWKFLGFSFQGSLEIEGTLKANPGESYGHLGGFDAELTEARIKSVVPRLWRMAIVAVSVICLVGVAAVRRRKRLRDRA
jgi:hypothetical protein